MFVDIVSAGMGQFRRTTSLLLVAAVFAVISVAAPDNDILQRDDDYRLNDAVEPKHYDIKIIPEYEDGEPVSFTGTVTITAVTKSVAISQVTLHAGANINIESVDVFASSSENPLFKSIYKTAPQEFLTIVLEEEVLANTELSIQINYTSEFPNNIYGFYISKYTVKTQNGEKTEDELLATQFQPTYARRAFPCFDEPGFKATFKLTLVIPEGYDALSNTHQLSSQSSSDFNSSMEINFDVTPRMSTYLVAFIIYNKGTYKATSSAQGSPTFRTWGRATEINAGAGALSQREGPPFILAMQKYTGISYYLSKIDQAALPDLSFGGMENWGLVTYRETSLLYNNLEHTQLTKKRIAQLIAHELSHQWFGNLVTTKWWEATWLNEGFATFFEYYLLNEVHPLWRMQERFVVDEQLPAFAADAIVDASPLTKDVSTPNEVSAHFGTITYRKGGSLVRMFSNILGEERFQAALKYYLQKNLLNSVTPVDLFDALAQHATHVEDPIDLNFHDIFESWTNTSGFPVIKVTQRNSKIEITQAQFLLDGSKSNQKYNAYITLISNDDNYTPQKKWLLETREKTTVESVPEAEKWILVESTGYFRVNYDDENWELLANHLHTEDLEKGRISPLERGVLLDNALNLARSGKLPYSTAIQLLSYLEREIDYIPWSIAFSGLNFLNRMISNEEAFQNFMKHVLDKVYEEVGFKVVEKDDDETHIEHVHRTNVLNWACRVGHPDCIANAVAYLEKYLDSEENAKVLPELRSIVYCYGAQNDEHLWTKMWSKLGDIEDTAERSLFISALGCANVSSTLYMYLEASLSGEYIKPQETASVFSSVYSNPENVDTVLDFMRFDHRKLERATASIRNTVPNIISGIAQYLKTERHKTMLGELTALLNETVSESVADAAIETVNDNIQWNTAHRSTVLKELEAALARPATPGPEPAPTTEGARALRPAAAALALLAAALGLLR